MVSDTMAVPQILPYLRAYGVISDIYITTALTLDVIVIDVAKLLSFRNNNTI